MEEDSIYHWLALNYPLHLLDITFLWPSETKIQQFGEVSIVIGFVNNVQHIFTIFSDCKTAVLSVFVWSQSLPSQEPKQTEKGAHYINTSSLSETALSYISIWHRSVTGATLSPLDIYVSKAELVGIVVRTVRVWLLWMAKAARWAHEGIVMLWLWMAPGRKMAHGAAHL